MTKLLTAQEVAAKMNEFGGVDQMRSNRIRIAVPLARVREAIERARTALACDHVVQIAAVDNGKSLELIYHLTGPHRTVLSIATEVSRDRPEAPTVSDLLPPAGIYERQIYDLLGIVFVGHPDLRRIILNEDWPADEFPLRKDWKPKPDVFYGGATEEGT